MQLLHMKPRLKARKSIKWARLWGLGRNEKRSNCL